MLYGTASVKMNIPEIPHCRELDWKCNETKNVCGCVFQYVVLLELPCVSSSSVNKHRLELNLKKKKKIHCQINPCALYDRWLTLE